MDSDREVAERRLGQTVGGKWRLERLLGTGGMAAVYAASGPDGTQAALKLLHPEMTLKRDVRERFVREAYVSNRVQHPGAVRILEHGDSQGEAYLVMELLDGEPLGDRVRRVASLPPEELLGYLDQVLDVLAAAHAQGIIHRDIKPDNLFVLRDGRVKVLDFGLARMLDEMPGDFKTRTGLALGTLPYMAPEQALGKRGELDGRVDLFALGATAFRILAKRRVHEADSEAELLVAMATKPVAPLASVLPTISKNVCAIIDLSLAFSKDARYPDARTMQADVRAVLEGRDPPYAIGNGVVEKRDLPTRVDREAPVVAGVPLVGPSSVPSLPSVPHPIAAGARATGTAVMPVMEGRAAPDAPTRVDSPAAQITHGPTVPDPMPPSVAPASLQRSDPPPPSVAAMAYAPAHAHPISQPPPRPARSSALPLLLALGALALLGIGGVVVLAFATDAFSMGGEEAATASSSAPAAPSVASETPPADESGEMASADPNAGTPESDEDGEAATAKATSTPRNATSGKSSTAASSPKSPATSAPLQAPPAAPAATRQATTPPASTATATATAAPALPTATTTSPPPTTEPKPAGPGNSHDKGKGNDKGKGKGNDKGKGKKDK